MNQPWIDLESFVAVHITCLNVGKTQSSRQFCYEGLKKRFQYYVFLNCFFFEILVLIYIINPTLGFVILQLHWFLARY